MKGAISMGVAIVAFVVAMTAPAGAGSFPNDGKIYLKNQSDLTIGISFSDASYWVAIGPRERFYGYNINRYEDVGYDFDVDLDGYVDTTYTINLQGAKKRTHTIGNFGLISIVNQE
jgi:hypothetical protein